MERKISKKIISIHDAFIESEKLIKKFPRNAYLSSVLLDLNKKMTVNKITFLYYNKLFIRTGYKSYIIQIDNMNLKASYSGQGIFPQKQMDELSLFDPASYPPRKIEIEKVKIDTEQLFKIAFDEPPHFVFSELEHITAIDASLFVQDDQIIWSFLCENEKIGFRTLHINAESGNIVYNKLDKINN